MIDIKSARAAYNDETIDDLIWSRRTYNFAASMTKAHILVPLFNMTETGNAIIKFKLRYR